jgi:hypothetical protein
MPHVEMEHAEDPKQAILNAIGDVSGVELFNNQILLAVYIRPEKTKGGIYLSNKTTDEDRYQSKVGLLVKKGPNAFVDPDGVWFKDVSFDIGDWLVHRSSDGWSMEVNKVLCRVLSDTQVKARVDGPDRVY